MDKINKSVFYADFSVFLRRIKARENQRKCKIVLRFLSPEHYVDETEVVRKFNYLQL